MISKALTGRWLSLGAAAWRGFRSDDLFGSVGLLLAIARNKLRERYLKFASNN